MNVRKALVGTLLTLGMVVVGASAQAARYDVDITVAPPPDRVEHVPPPRHGYVWAPGYWRWDHGHYAWSNGHFIREHEGHHWVAHRWVHEGDRWRMEEGHWD